MNIQTHIARLAKESAVYSISGALSGIAMIFLVPIYTRSFSVAEYGIYSLLLLLGGMLTMFSVLALDSAASRWFFDDEDKRHQQSTISSWFRCQAVCSTLLALLLCCFLSPLSRWLSDNCQQVRLPLLLVAATIPASTVHIIFSCWLRYRRRAVLAVFTAVLQLALSLGLTFWLVLVRRMGLTGVFTANLATVIVLSSIGGIVMRHYLSPGKFSFRLLKEMLHYSLPLIPAALCLWIMVNMDRFMLKFYIGDREVGLYSVASTIALSVGLLTTAFSQAWGPFAFSIMNTAEAKSVYAKVNDYYMFLGCIAGTGVALLAPLLLRIFATEEYYSVAGITGILCFGTLLNGSRYVAALGCSIAKRSVPNAVSIMIGAGVNLVLNMLLIPLFGISGAAWATVIAWLSSVFYLYAASQKCYYIPYRWKSAIYSVLLAAGLISVNYFIWGGSCTVPGVLLRLSSLLLFIPLGVILGLVPNMHKRLILKQ